MDSEAPWRPLVSVIVPTHDRPDALERCVEALARQSYPSEYVEVIVVDDGSRSPIDRAWARDSSVRVVRQENAGPAAARNAGAAAAGGEVLAFTDDDCEPQPDWLERLVTRITESPEALVAGGVRNGVSDNDCAEASQLLVTYLVEQYNADPSAARFFTSNNMALRRAVFVRLGGFEPTYRQAAAEDRDLCQRALRLGVPVVFAADAVVTHLSALSLRGLFRQHQAYGRGACRLHAATRASDVNARGLERPWFYVRLVTAPVGRSYPAGRCCLLVALLACTQVAHGVGYLRELRASRGEVGARG